MAAAEKLGSGAGHQTGIARATMDDAADLCAGRPAARASEEVPRRTGLARGFEAGLRGDPAPAVAASAAGLPSSATVQGCRGLMRNMPLAGGRAFSASGAALPDSDRQAQRGASLAGGFWWPTA